LSLKDTMPDGPSRFAATRFQRPGATLHSSVSFEAARAGKSFARTPPRRAETVSFGVTVTVVAAERI
jgi:hypothetical protein